MVGHGGSWGQRGQVASPSVSDARTSWAVLQSCLARTVLAPERFWGGVAPSALRRRDGRRLSRAVSAATASYQLRRGDPTRNKTSSMPATTPRRGARSAGGAGPPASRELVGRARARLVGGTLAGELGERALDLAPDSADGDPEDALPALEQVDDLVVARALVDGRAVAHQGDPGEVVGAALAQVLHGGADLLQGDPGVEQPLDDLQEQDVAEGVEPLGAGAGGAADARLDEPGARPVVELPVGDPGGVAGHRAAVAGVAGEGGDIVVEQQPLLVGDLGGLVCRGLVGCAMGSHVVLAVHR